MSDHESTEGRRWKRPIDWRDIDPLGVMVFVIALVQLAMEGFGWPWFNVAAWSFCFVGEKALRKTAEREAATWKQEAVMVKSAAILLVYAAAGGDLTVSKAPDGMALDEAQRRVDAMVREVRRVG